jgi:hypothetical protein
MLMVSKVISSGDCVFVEGFRIQKLFLVTIPHQVATRLDCTFLDPDRERTIRNGANSRVVWDNLSCGFLIAGAMADLDHLMPGNVHYLVRIWPSFHRSGFSSEWSARNLPIPVPPTCYGSSGHATDYRR